MVGRRWFRRQNDLPSSGGDDICSGNIREFSYASLQVATTNFSVDKLIGRGGFGSVYRGVLSNGTLVAVKKSNCPPSGQGIREFITSAEVMSHIRHRNIIRVIGYCRENDCQLLVSEYAVNGSLDNLLRDPQRKESSFLDWNRRASICIGIARGLSYLHHDANPFIIHRDIKTSNILVDTNYNPKISDFGVVKFFYDPNQRELPHETGRIIGTMGYMAPEYVLKGQYSDKTDVYAFGVVMLEIISGRRAIADYNKGSKGITIWASELVKDDRVMDIIDPMLTDYPTDAVQGFITVALSCVQPEPNLRPDMLEISHMLHGLCNSTRVSLQSPRISMLELADRILTNAWSDSPMEGLIDVTDLEDEGECSVIEDQGNVILTEIQSADPNKELEVQGEEGAETSAAGEQREQSNTSTVSAVAVKQQQQQMKPGNTLSGSGALAERYSQTRVFKKHSRYDCPEAVYPPFRTRVYRRLGSRNLYTF